VEAHHGNKKEISIYGQDNEVPVDTRLASYSVKKKGYKDQVSYVRSITADTSLTQSIKESAATTYDFSNIASVSGKNTALESCLTSAIKAMSEYQWSGNVRELQNVVERAYILSEGMIIEKLHLDQNIQNAEELIEEKKIIAAKPVEFVHMTLEELERNHIMGTLESLGGNKTRAANVFEIDDELLAHAHIVAKKVATALKEATGCEGINILQNNVQEELYIRN
jgi:hypothetical protein